MDLCLFMTEAWSQVAAPSGGFQGSLPFDQIFPLPSVPVLSIMELEAARQLSRGSKAGLSWEERNMSPIFPKGPGLLAPSSVMMCLGLALS